MTKPKSISELIANWKTIGNFSDAIGCGYEAARKMRDRESIAPEHWPAVVSASVSKGVPGITFEWLAVQRAKAARTGEAA